MPKWPDVYSELNQRGLKSVSPKEAAQRIAKGEWVLVDVRPPTEFEKAHPANAVSVPMYQPMDYSNVDAGKIFKTIAYAFNGVTPVEPNPNFAAQVRAAAAGKKAVVTACEAGGTMTPSTNFPFGKASRSLQAAYRVMTEGLASDVVHLERGVYGWWQAGLDFTGDYQPDVGRTPSAAAEPALKNVAQSVGYEMREGDKTVEPEKKGFWPFN